MKGGKGQQGALNVYECAPGQFQGPRSVTELKKEGESYPMTCLIGWEMSYGIAGMGGIKDDYDVVVRPNGCWTAEKTFFLVSGRHESYGMTRQYGPPSGVSIPDKLTGCISMKPQYE